MNFTRQFNQRKALRFRQFTRKGYALFACLGRVVTIGVLSVATLRSAAVTTTDTLSVVGTTVVGDSVANSPDKEATLDDVEITGSRAPLALGQAARMVTVLSREEIQAAPVQSIRCTPTRSDRCSDGYRHPRQHAGTDYHSIERYQHLRPSDRP